MALQVSSGALLAELEGSYLPDEYHAKLTQMATAKLAEIEKAHAKLAQNKHYTQIQKNPYKGGVTPYVPVSSGLVAYVSTNIEKSTMDPQMLKDAMTKMVANNLATGTLRPEVTQDQLDPRKVLTALMIARDRHTHLGWGPGWEGPCIGSTFGVGPIFDKLRLDYGAEALEYVVMPNTPMMQEVGYISWNDQIATGIEDVFAAIDRAIEATELQLAVSA